MRDPLDSAIRKTAPMPQAPEAMKGNFRLSSGRVVGIVMPVDTTTADLLELVATIAANVPGKLEELRAPKSGLVVARGILQPPTPIRG